MIRVFLVLTCVLGLLGCTVEEGGTDSPRPDPRVAEVDLTIGVEEGEEPYMFGRIGKLAVGPQGRIFVPDLQAHEVRVFGPDGTHQFTFGGQGSGPGDLHRPTSVAFGPEGDLWVRDSENRRYARYRTRTDTAVQVEQVRMTHSAFGLTVGLLFDGQGHLIDVGGERRDGEFRSVRFYRTRDDSTVRTQLVPAAPEERVPVFRARTDAGFRYFHPPFGATDLHAHGPGGDWAFTITDRYEVVRYNARGDTMHVIERSVEGPRLSQAEKERAEERLREITAKTEASRAEIPFGVPARKPPLRHILFDQSGRLWVQRTVADTASMAEADVYGERGRLVDVVRWPRDVRLNFGMIRGHEIYGIRGGSETPPRLVRLQY